MKLILKGQASNFKGIDCTVTFKRKALQKGYAWVTDDLNKQDIWVSTGFLLNLDRTEFKL